MPGARGRGGRVDADPRPGALAVLEGASGDPIAREDRGAARRKDRLHPRRPGMSPIRRALAHAYGADVSRLERRFKMIAASATTNATPASRSPAMFAGSSDGL